MNNLVELYEMIVSDYSLVLVRRNSKYSVCTTGDSVKACFEVRHVMKKEMIVGDLKNG